MKKSTLARAKRAIRLMREGVSFSRAAAAVSMKPKTLRKAMRVLKIPSRRIRGRVKLIDKVTKQKIDMVIYYMMGGWSATRSCKQIHTTLRTMSKQIMNVSGRKRKIIIKKGAYYHLNVYRIVGHHIVFYGRLMGLGLARPDGSREKKKVVTGVKNPREPERDESKLTFDDPNYYNILWQLDFDPFHTTLLAEDVIIKYSAPVLEALKSIFYEIDAATGVIELRNIFERCSGFDNRINGGIDDRDVTEVYLSPVAFRTRKNRVRKDVGNFEIIVRRFVGSDHYPSSPIPIEFEHDLAKESGYERSANPKLMYGAVDID